MPAPKASTVVLILAVFACVAFYVLGVGLGATDDSRAGRSSMSKEERLRLRDRFIRPRPVKTEELRAECPMASGVLTVAPRWSVRLMKPTSGRWAGISATATPCSTRAAMVFHSRSFQAPVSVV